MKASGKYEPHQSNRLKEIEKLQKQIEKAEREYSEIILDAHESAKLSEWEKSFVAGLFLSLKREIVTKVSQLSTKQQKCLRQIEVKIYGIG